MAVCDGSADNSNWMKNLPECLHIVPLNQLAIPGTHNSFAFQLDESGAVAADAADSVHNLVTFLGSPAKSIVANWSRTQSLGVEAQLRAGVRYFDIRVSSRPGTLELFVIHGLYGPTVESCLDSLATFLDEHCHEIVLLDFNHFYNMDAVAHDRLINTLLDRFSSKMCPVMDISELSLQMLWSAGLQLIVFYHSDSTLCEAQFQLWPASSIPAPWYNTTSCPALLSAVSRDNVSRLQSPSHTFHVMQAILTPDGAFIFSHLTQRLSGTLAGQALKPLLDWLQLQKTGINIVTVDFIESTQLIQTLLDKPDR